MLDANALAFVEFLVVHLRGCQNSFHRHREVLKAIAVYLFAMGHQYASSMKPSCQTATNP